MTYLTFFFAIRSLTLMSFNLEATMKSFSVNPPEKQPKRGIGKNIRETVSDLRQRWDGG